MAKIFFEKEIPEDNKVLISKSLKKIQKSLKAINSLGYWCYLSPSTLTVVDGNTHPNPRQADHGVEICSVYVEGIDGGEW